MDALEAMRSYIGKEFDRSPSPFMRWLRPMVVSVEKGSLEFKYVIRNEWLNPMERLHGGVTAAIIDDMLGATMFSLDEPFYYTTINNTIDYFSVAQENDEITAKTKIIKKGRQFIHAECEIWGRKGTRLIARGTSNLFKTQIKK
ncbi:PaaI family thioesterase [Pedobacter sp.]|uniref:PaaI family thioesterase n=1 Tax=Pedobacter sp. TaxID=1411316 RepID=UPI0031D59E06